MVMATKLKVKSSRKVNGYEPVELEGGITLNMSRLIEDESAQLNVTASVSKDGGEATELGKASISTSSNHLFVQVTPVSALGVEGTVRLAGTLVEYLMEMYKAD